MWGATDTPADKLGHADISIHAPRVGGDFARDPDALLDLIISIHAPRVGGDYEALGWEPRNLQFQSTPPVWGATLL